MRSAERTAPASACDDTHRSNRKFLLGLGLAAVAGCVDSIAFLSMRGFFASFMSGNSTRLAIGLATADKRVVLLCAGLIVLFVSGVILGSLLAAPRRVLAMVSVLLLLSALSASVLSGHAGRQLPIALAVAALGAANTVVQQAGRISVTATYITGTLVRMGQGIAASLKGGARWDWLPYALLWSSLLAGAVTGAALFPSNGLEALWLPAAACLALAAIRPDAS